MSTGDPAVPPTDQLPSTGAPAADAPTPGRPVSPAATAARRARHMGGRPSPTPAGNAQAAGAATPVRPAPAEPVVGSSAASEVAPESNTAAAGGSRTAATVLSALVLVGLVIAAAVLGVQALQSPYQITANENQRVLSAAKSGVPLLTSYSYQSIDSDAAKAEAVLTGEFRSEYAKSVSTVIKPQLPTTKTVAVGQVDTAGLESAGTSGSQAVVVVYGQQAVTNAAQTTPRIDPFQLRVTMQRVDGKWLIAKVDQLGASLSDAPRPVPAAGDQ